MRARRIENEWLLLEALQQANSDRLRLLRQSDLFVVEVSNLPALMASPACSAKPDNVVKHTHRLRIVFPRYYPSMPLEVYIEEPVFHPNVHPDTGFVCLWTKHRIQTTLEHTLAQLQRVLCWELLNIDAEHVMQPAALIWYKQLLAREYLPLKFVPFLPVNAESWITETMPKRRRLS